MREMKRKRDYPTEEEEGHRISYTDCHRVRVYFDVCVYTIHERIDARL